MKNNNLPDIFKDPEIMAVGWTDIHSHLNSLSVSAKEALEKAGEEGFKRIITVGTEPDDLPIVLKLCETYSFPSFPHVFCTLGIHPHESKLYNKKVEDFLKSHLPSSPVVAVGEIGLDYYYNYSPKEIQQKVFRSQMDLAEQLQLPVQIHTREAEEDTIEILKEYRGRVRGVIHCFTGSQRLADQALDCGWNISFSGVVTFKNAGDLREVCRRIPLDRIHVETDAPYLAPVPMRGQKNQPHFMLWTVLLISKIKKVELIDFCRQVKQNTDGIFHKLNRETTYTDRI